MSFYCGADKALPHGATNWQDAFGKLYANMQVHCLERGFHDALQRGGLEYGKDVFRYRFDWRTSGCNLPKNWGVTHSTDMDIWFYGMDSRDGLTEEEKAVLRPWNEAFARFVHGEEMEGQWKTKDVRQMVRLKEDGVTDVWVDNRWQEGVQCWKAVNESTGGWWTWVRSRL
jgi:carboxylesterase type B